MATATLTPRETVALLLQRDRSSLCLHQDGACSSSADSMTTDLASESLLTEIPVLSINPHPRQGSTNAQNLIKSKLKKRLKGLPSVVVKPVKDEVLLQVLKQKNEELEETIRVLHSTLFESKPSSAVQQVQVDFQDTDLIAANEMISQLRTERDQNGNLLQEERQRVAKMTNTIEELQTQLEQSNKNSHTIQAHLMKVIDSESRFKEQAEELEEQVSDYETKLVQSQADVETLQELYQVIHQDILAYRKIEGLFSPGTNILKSLTQEREAAKNEKLLMSGQIADLEKKLVKAQKHIKDIANVSQSQEELSKLKEQLQRQKQSMEGDSLIWEETKLKLKLASEESESLKQKSLQDKKEIKRLLERIESQKCEIKTMDATVAQYEKNMSAQHSLKHSLDQKLKILTSQLEAKDVLLRDQIQKTSVLQEQMQGQKKEAVDRESVQAQIIKLKQESSRKEALVKYWKDKFQIIEEAHGSLLKTNLSLQEQQNGSIFKVKVLSDKETRLTGELERFTSLEHRYLQLLRVLQTVLQEFIQKRTKERAEAKKKEFSEPVLKRMKGLSREYLGLDLPALMEKEPALNEQLSTILTKTDFEAELLLFLKEQVLH